ncbi:MAG: DUF4912 domain-containing protein [Clostridia bacterium]|nr:DUF4912 domain-containing protein [Clostridia bacterium]
MTEGSRLPGEYGENMMMLLVQAPQVLFVYWEMSKVNWKSICCPTYLRLYQLQGFDFEKNILLKEVMLPPFSDSWYFYEVQVEKHYVCEIGFKNEQEFLSVLRSNIVLTPPLPVEVFIPRMVRRPDHPEFAGIAQPVSQLTQPPIKQAKELEQPVKEIIREMPFYLGLRPDDF